LKNPIYEIKNLKSEGKEKFVLDIKKLEIHRGSCYVFYGDVGSGKTTLLNCLSKNKTVPKNIVKYETKDITTLSKSEFRKDVYFVPQKIDAPWFKISVNDYLLKKISSYKHLSNPKRKVADIVKNMGLSKYLNRNFKELSPGEKRWVELAVSIAADTKVLFIDGFGQYLGDDKINSLCKILYRKINYDGVTVVVATHIREKLSKIASVLIKLDGGRIVSVRSKKKTYKTSKNKNISRGNSKRRESRKK
tara:strand:- start:52 stop:795 length:744 start_codon:yes stop_codon:yes gene_type:complete